MVLFSEPLRFRIAGEGLCRFKVEFYSVNRSFYPPLKPVSWCINGEETQMPGPWGIGVTEGPGLGIQERLAHSRHTPSPAARVGTRPVQRNKEERGEEDGVRK